MYKTVYDLSLVPYTACAESISMCVKEPRHLGRQRHIPAAAQVLWPTDGMAVGHQVQRKEESEGPKGPRGVEPVMTLS